MGQTSTALKLRPSLEAEARRLAREDGVSLNEFINSAVAEKLSALETEAYFAARAARGNREAFLAVLDRAADKPPIEGDRIL